MNKTKIAVLVSGGGTNLQALIDAQKNGVITSGKIQLVVSNNINAYALERAKLNDIKTAVILKKDCASQLEFEQKIKDVLKENGIELIVLAGFMSILSESFTRDYDERIINVHPSLIPSFCGKGYYGLKVHEEALKKGVKVTGATVHYVNEIADGGKIIMQKAVSVLEGDTPQVLQKRVMEEAEWQILPEATEQISKKILMEKKIMNVYKIHDIAELIKDNSYVGRGIVIGKTKDGSKAVTAYFIMGRSANSRNRVFTYKNDVLYTEPFDVSKVEDPSLIIYAAVRKYENKLIVTNGDQTDTIYEGLKEGKCFTKSLKSREFEPDAPNLTPRISGMIDFLDGDFTYKMSILKSADSLGTKCNRYTFDFASLNGLGHFIHTYVCDGNPIPTFQGEPERVEILDDIDEFTNKLWGALNQDNKISLFVRYTDLATGEEQDRIINKNA